MGTLEDFRMDRLRIRERLEAAKAATGRIAEMKASMKRGRYYCLCEDADGHLRADDTPRMLRATKAHRKMLQRQLALLRSYVA